MKIQAIKTDKVLPGGSNIFEMLDSFLPRIKEESVVAITSKVISICEGSVVPIGNIDKEELIREQADFFMPSKVGKYGYHFTIKNNTLISMSGIDESNGNGNYVLWPKGSQKTANSVRAYLVKRFGIKRVGVIITDSTSTPMRLGTTGIALGYSGFKPLHDYIGRLDLFGRRFEMSRASVVTGLASTANMVMGEGNESTPIIVMEDLPFVKFHSRNPTPEELESISVPLSEDIYEPFLNSVEWMKGGGGKK